LSACPKEALTLTERGIVINRNSCDGCGACAPVCPTKAMEILGTERSVDDVAEEALRDLPFYEESGGGVTLSGGDPLFQFEFTKALLTRFREEGLHTALDTAGFGELEQFQAIVKMSDLVLLDIKMMDPALQEAYTGVPLDPIIRNAKWLGSESIPVWIRTPVIPGFTDSQNNVAFIASFIRKHLPNVERWDFLGFNNLCAAKWQRLDVPFACAETPLVSGGKMTQIIEAARASCVSLITWSGVTREAASKTQEIQL